MKIKSRLLINTLGLASASLIRKWMSTLEYKAAFYDPALDPVDPACHGQKIYLFWHEYMLFPLALRGNCNLSMLVSRHTDADVLTRVAAHLGFDFVRGSTRRGGLAALRELVARSGHMHLTITPDGPRGPRRTCASGAIFLSSRLQMPLVLLGFGYDRPWRMKSWDRFAIPRPGSRARAVVSPEMQIPPDVDRAGIEHYRRQVDRLLGRLTLEAEAWAESGTAKIAQRVIRAEPSRNHLRRRDSRHMLGPGHAALKVRSARRQRTSPPGDGSRAAN